MKMKVTKNVIFGITQLNHIMYSTEEKYETAEAPGG